MSSPYFDTRSELWKLKFNQAFPYEKYLLTGSSTQQSKWKSFEQALVVPKIIEDRCRSFSRKMKLLCMSGIWCGDCARQGPMLAKLASLCPHAEVRFIDNKQNPDLQSELRLNGAEKVPVVVLLSEDFFEIARFGDRHLSVYRRKGATELGAACDPGLIAPGSEQLSAELSEWTDFLERGYWMLRLAPLLRERYGD